jgi:hypothetical protein
MIVLENYAIEVKTSPFVKLIFIIGCLEKKLVNATDKLLCNNSLNQDELRVIFDYMVNNELISQDGRNFIYLNQNNVEELRNNILEFVKEFYKIYFFENSINPNNVIKYYP